MYQMSHDITIGSYRLKLVESVRVVKSMDSLSDTATIVLPGMVMGKTIDVEGKIAEGDKVRVMLGYDGVLREEFRGYVDSVSAEGGSIKIECLDELLLFKRKSLDNKQYKKIKLSTLLQQVCNAVDKTLTVDCDYDVTYDTFTVFNATGYDVLRKVQDEIKANIYFNDGALVVHAPYRVDGSERVVGYDFQRNIESSDLRYVRARDKKIEVELTIYQKDGKVQKVSHGTTGGEKVSRTSVAVDVASAKRMAREEYEALVFDGYEGSFTGWLLPAVEPGDVASLKDADYPEKDGRYYVVGVETQYSKAGGSRKVSLGRRVR